MPCRPQPSAVFTGGRPWSTRLWILVLLKLITPSLVEFRIPWPPNELAVAAPGSAPSGEAISLPDVPEISLPQEPAIWQPVPPLVSRSGRSGGSKRGFNAGCTCRARYVGVDLGLARVHTLDSIARRDLVPRVCHLLFPDHLPHLSIPPAAELPARLQKTCASTLSNWRSVSAWRVVRPCSSFRAGYLLWSGHWERGHDCSYRGGLMGASE